MSNYRVASTCGALEGVRRAMRRYRCDGHLNPERHHIEVGALFVASALPPHHPDVGNTGWWHARFCMECAPAKFTDGVDADA